MEDLDLKAEAYANSLISRGVLRAVAKAAYKAGFADAEKNLDKLADDVDEEAEPKKVFIKG